MDDQLKTLFEYTKFHIGVYITIGTGLVGALAFDAVDQNFSLGECGRFGLQLSLLFQAIAGIGGGIVAANLINFTTLKAFREAPIYWGLRPLFWERLEHWSFWASVIIGAVSGVFLIQ